MSTFKTMLQLAKTREILLAVISSMMFIIVFLFALSREIDASLNPPRPSP